MKQKGVERVMVERHEVLGMNRHTLSVLELVRLERARQDKIWGGQRDLPFTEWLAILTEEVGEAVKARNEGAAPGVVHVELLQAAAVLVAWVESNIEQNRVEILQEVNQAAIDSERTQPGE